MFGPNNTILFLFYFSTFFYHDTSYVVGQVIQEYFSKLSIFKYTLC